MWNILRWQTSQTLQSWSVLWGKNKKKPRNKIKVPFHCLYACVLMSMSLVIHSCLIISASPVWELKFVESSENEESGIRSERAGCPLGFHVRRALHVIVKHTMATETSGDCQPGSTSPNMDRPMFTELKYFMQFVRFLFRNTVVGSPHVSKKQLCTFTGQITLVFYWRLWSNC